MMGGETFKMAVRSMVEVCKEVLNESGFTADDVAWLLPHQANERIITAVGDRLEIPAERCIITSTRYGNTSAASIPIALDEYVAGRPDQEGRPRSSSRPSAAGLTWGAALVRW